MSGAPASKASTQPEAGEPALSRPRVPRLHLVTDDRVLSAPDFLRRAASAIEGAANWGGAIAIGGKGPPGRENAAPTRAIAIAETVGTALHLRAPGLGGRRLWELGRALLPLCRAAGVSLFVNDRLDLALLLGGEGVHLGRRSLPPTEARTLLGNGPLLGVSVHGQAELRDEIRSASDVASASAAIDYFLAGSVFPTASHPERTPMGAEGLAELVSAAQGVPVVAIGGITGERVAATMAAGGYGVALLSGIWGGEDPGAAVSGLLDRIGQSLQTSGAREG